MRMLFVALLLVSPVMAQDGVPPGYFEPPSGEVAIEVSFGWDGNRPPQWAVWTEVQRTEYVTRCTHARADLTAYVETCRIQRPELCWNADVGFDLFSRSVNAGFSFDVSFDLVRTMIVENVQPADATVIMKTVAVEEQKSEVDLVQQLNVEIVETEREEEHMVLGQWVKQQVQSGVRGQDLAVSIHVKIQERHDQKKAQKQLEKQRKQQEKELKKEEKKKEKEEKDEEKEKGKGKGKGKGH